MRDVNEAGNGWWMLVCTRVPGRHRMRSGCIGVYKSKDLLNWEAAEPLCAPETNSHHECPQVIRHQGKWYLFNIQRQDQYYVADSLEGPWRHSSCPYLGPHTAISGSRLASDGRRWVSFPFLLRLSGGNDFGDVTGADAYAVPRELVFFADGNVGLRPFSFWDRDRVLVSGRMELPVGTPFKVRMFLSGTMLEVFIADRMALSSRVYRHAAGVMALDTVDGKAVFSNIVVRSITGDSCPPIGGVE